MKRVTIDELRATLIVLQQLGLLEAYRIVSRKYIAMLKGKL